MYYNFTPPSLIFKTQNMDKQLLDYFNGNDFPASVWKGKYAAKTEITPNNMHKRMAKEFVRVDKQYQAYEKNMVEKKKLSDYGRSREPLTKNIVFNLFKDFKYIIPQGRVMAGLGVKESYRSLSNCLRLPPPKDSYSSILYVDTMLVSSAKRGCGYGLGLSNLRPANTTVKNAANSSTGAASFMERYSNSTREVAQAGRRGACLLDLSIFHPDVLEFITKKKDRTKVTGANISVKLYNEFMEAVENDGDFFLRFPCDSNWFGGTEENFPYNELVKWGNIYVKRIKARKYWEEIIENAHANAEPGLFFWDRIENYDPSQVYFDHKIDGTNACGEQPMSAYDTCRLILLNLYSFVKKPFTKKAEIDYDLLYRMSYEQLRLGDNLVDLEIEYVDRILDKIEKDNLPEKEKAIELELWKLVRIKAMTGRRVGCGITALGDMLAALGLKYDSEEAFEVIERVMKTKMKAELDAGTDLAILRGPFTQWQSFREIKMKGKEGLEGGNDFYTMLIDEFLDETKRMYKFGRRNINWSTIAPAGSTSILAKTENFFNLSSGCEPNFMPYHMRKKKINPADENVRVDFVDQNGDSWMEYPVIMGAFKEWLLLYTATVDKSPEDWNKEEMEGWFKLSPWYGSTANEIDWIKRIEIQALLQKYTTSAISSTLNLPKDVSKKTVSDIYFAGWKHGLKGVTIYRDGCRTGVLTTGDTNTPFEYKDAVKRPKKLLAETYHSTSKGEAYTVIVGLLDDKPYEIFIDDSDNRYSSEGTIVKEKRGKYVFHNGGDPINIRTFMNDEQEAITRLVSANLRHGTDVKFVVEQLQKTPGDMFSFTKSLARVLKKYIPDGESSTVGCLECGSRNVIFQEGCNTCRDCGSSKCG